MDGTVRYTIQRCINGSDDITEPQYDVVNDQDTYIGLHPVRSEEEAYADRNPLWSSIAQSSASHRPGTPDVPPRSPHTETPHTVGPAVNRDLKPGRRKTVSDEWSVPVPTREQPPTTNLFDSQHSLRQCPLTPSSIGEVQKQVTGFIPRRNAHLKARKGTVFSQHATGRENSENVDLQLNHRHSWNLDTDQSEMRLNLENVPSQRNHHEWPQTKEDSELHHFVPQEKPKQMYCEEDWYVGDCKRTDAEHALHLVNKDGAFLVRDCSSNTNSEPLVLAVYHEKKVYNIKIHFLESSSKFTLGTVPRTRDMFNSVADIIKFHTIFPIVLISGRNVPGGKHPENCVLTYAVTKRDVDRLLQ